MVCSSAPRKLPQTNGETPVTEHETNLRDLAAMFAMAGLLVRNKEGEAIVPIAFDLANQFIEQRKEQLND